MVRAIVESFKRASFTAKMIYLYAALLPVASGLLFVTRGFEKIHLSDLVFIPMFVSWIVQELRSRSFLKDKGDKPLYFILAALLISTLLSFINSVDRFHSAVDWIGLAYLATLFLIVVRTINTREAFTGLLAAYSAGAVTAAVVGLGSLGLYLIKGDLGNNPLLMLNQYQASLLTLPRIKVFFSTPNMFAAFEHVGIVALFALYFMDKRKPLAAARPVITASIIIVALSLFMTGSQTIAGIAITLLIISFLFTGKAAAAVRYLLFMATAAILVFVICATIWMIFPVSINADRVTRDLDIRINYAYSYHIIPSICALSMFKKHPVVGVGMGTFMDNYPAYIDPDIDKITAAKQGGLPNRAVDPHNTFTGALAEWGLLGFTAMLAIFAYMFRALASGPIEPVRIVLLAGFIGLILNAFFIDSMMLRWFWMFMAFIVIFDKIRRQESMGAAR